MFHSAGVILLAFSAIVLSVVSIAAAAESSTLQNYKIAVLDNSGIPSKHYNRWAPTFEGVINAHAERLGADFRLYVTVLPFDNLTAAATNRDVDMTLTNTGHSAIIENTVGFRPLVSLENMRLGNPLSIFGGVASTHVNSTIQTIGDCFKPGRKVAAVSKKSFGGYLMQKREALRQGATVKDDEVTFTGSHEGAMEAANDRSHDCSFARTDRLESNQQKNPTIVNNLRVLEEKSGTDYSFFPFKCSTQLYPEWVVLAGPTLPSDVFDLMRAMMLSVRTTDDAAVVGQYSRWFPPSSSAEVVQALYETNALARPTEATGFPVTSVVVPILAVMVLTIILMVLRTVFGEKKGRDLRFAPKAAPFAIVFTDIQSSTTLWAREPAAMSEAVELHHEIIRKLLTKHKGYEVKTIGDSFMNAFSELEDALAFAMEVQTAMHEANWPPEIEQAYREMLDALGASSLWNGIRVRVAVNYGEGEALLDTVTGGYDYYGTLVNTAARIEAAAHGGQVVVCAAAFGRLKAPMKGMSVTDLGSQSLRGLDSPVSLLQLAPEGPLSCRTFPPLRLDAKMELLEELESETHSRRTSLHSSLVLEGSEYLNVSDRARKLVAHDEDPLNLGNYERLVEFHGFLKAVFSTCPRSYKSKTVSYVATRWHVQGKGEEVKTDSQMDIVLLDLAAKVMKSLDVQQQHRPAPARHVHSLATVESASIGSPDILTPPRSPTAQN